MKKKYRFKNFQVKWPIFLWMLALSCSQIHGSFAQNQNNYSGTVKDSLNEPIPGVSIVIKGTTIGTVSDLDGSFNLPVRSDSDILVFSFIGYVTQEIPAQNNSIINIELLEDMVGLEEMVVIGYGTAQRKDLTGAASNITSENFNRGAITNPLQQIAGRAAGVNITQVGSEPGTNPSVRIRGITSLIGGNDPLVVVDGIQGNMDLLNQIPTAEIESIDILKDASATAIYGSRGAAGVIIVSTKKSKAGVSTIEYTGTTSVDVLANRLEMLSAEEWRRQANLWGVPASADFASNTDWYNILTQQGMTNNHTVSLGGGTENFNYRASIAAILQDGVVINSGNSNYIANIQATQSALEGRLKLSFSLNNSIRNNQGSPGNIGRASFTSNLISNAFVSRPTDPVFFEDGNYFSDQNVFHYINPYAVAQTVINESETVNQFGSLKADFEIIEGLNINWFGSWRKINHNSGYFAPVSSTIPSAIDQNGIANVSNNRTDEKLTNLSLNYQKDLGHHSFNAIGVYEWQRQTYQGSFAQSKGFINDLTSYHALQLGSIDRHLPGDISSYKNDRTLISILGRINYNYNDRYLFTASMRRDGSSVFGAGNKWGNFPSVSAAWRLSEEKFLNGFQAVSDLKFRVGYGITGNQQGLYPQQSLQLVNASGTTYFGESLINNYVVSQNANPDLMWETRHQTNIGIDFSLFNHKIGGTIDVFSATTNNLLFHYSVPQPPFPYGSMAANIGSVLNEGIEVSLNYSLLENKDWSIMLAGNFSLLRNEVLSLSGSLNGVELVTNNVGWGMNSFLIEGYPIGTFFILENDGKEAGTNEERVVDRNGDGIIDQGNFSEDRYIAGSALPTYTAAFTPKIRYKRFHLDMVWRASGGNKIYNRIRRDFSMYETLGISNLLQSAENLGLFTTQYASDLWLEDGDFIRLDNLTLSYDLMNLNSRWFKSSVVSITGNNLLLFTKYSGLDPELNASGGSGTGMDFGIYPRTRSIALSLQFSF
ncbi:SusC/RagA family TonB-linked outer membrane protein [Arthrospiribacter ruber]|uniref:TonB-dependent receptor n=1 Tax=Arthrospiribacter ruber TaxID=2487934 RepID=A0A951IWJ2_9BACT|nr:TonB-dependent receptor [Arthrospiribacter ruber]MBW3467041.1 TonB-dependent receptor [Arthrospiribacter ruber]